MCFAFSPDTVGAEKHEEETSRGELSRFAHQSTLYGFCINRLRYDTKYLLRCCHPALHCTENPINVFPEMKLCGLVPSSYIQVL
jgi:hypothetical protein